MQLRDCTRETTGTSNPQPEITERPQKQDKKSAQGDMFCGTSQALCPSLLPVAQKIPERLEEILNHGDSNDAIVLFQPLLVVILRTLKQLIHID